MSDIKSFNDPHRFKVERGSCGVIKENNQHTRKKNVNVLRCDASSPGEDILFCQPVVIMMMMEELRRSEGKLVIQNSYGDISYFLATGEYSYILNGGRVGDTRTIYCSILPAYSFRHL